MQILFYLVAYLVVAVLDTYVAHRARAQHSEAGSMLANCLACAALLSAFYFISITVTNPFIAITANTLCFATLDVMLIFMLSFVFAFMHGSLFENALASILVRVFMVLGVADVINVMLNPIMGHVATYTYLGPKVVPHFAFDAHLAYFVHLAFCYVLILLSFAALIHHAVKVPAMYRMPYYRIFACTAIIVVLNALYLLFFASSSADLTIIMYGVWGFAVYLSAFVYGNRNVLENTCFNTIMASSQPTIIFDYKGVLFHSNAAAKQLFPELEHGGQLVSQNKGWSALESAPTGLGSSWGKKWALSQGTKREPITYASFIKKLNLDKLPYFKDDRTRFYWTPTEPGAFSYICDYQEILDTHGKCVAQSLVFTNNTLSVDPLTSYLTEQYFEAHNAEITNLGKPPVAVAVCDLNQLGLLNNVLGFERGDDAIRLQADTMRKHLPEGTIFVRLHDARLAAICYGLEQEIVKSRLAMVNADLGESKDFNIRLRMDYAVSMVGEGQSAAAGMTGSVGTVGAAAAGAASASSEPTKSAASKSEPDTVVATAARATSILKTRKLLDKNSGHSSTLDSLNQMLTECDGETEGHVQRTRILGDSLAYELGLSDYERDQLSLLCLYHDIGKVGIPSEILKKPSALTDSEKAIMREHVQKGYRIARATPGLEIVAEPILHHHERWDGAGYPDGQKGEAIPVLSRVISVVDSYDAMVSDRPYHKGISSAEACEELKRCAGKQFDPFMVEAFVRVVRSDTAAAEVVAASEGSETPYRQEVIRSVEEATPSAQTVMMSPVEYSNYCLDENMCIIKVDFNFERLTGYTAWDIEHSTLTQNDLLFEEDISAYWEMVGAQLAQHGRMAYLEHRLRRKDGTGRYVYCMGVRVGKGDEAHFEVIVTDITDANSVRRQVNLARNRAMMSLRRLEENIQLDPMTELLNQSAFKKACARELSMGDSHCVLAMMDIDNFKGFNDTYGHPKGDVLLQEFAGALRGAVGPDDLLGRMGGDEFAALLVFDAATTLAQMYDRVEEFYAAVKGSFHDDIETPTFSMGVAQLELGETDFDELYELADERLYVAKDSGKAQLSW